jgi:fumarate reductase flavoprotein subunit
MQASLGNVIKGEGDNEDVHFEDTVRGSDWGADQDVVRMFVNTAPKAVRELAAWGVPWSRVRKGDRKWSSTANASPSPSATPPTAPWRSATSAAPRSGAPATWPTAPATPCCRRWATTPSATASTVHERTEAIALIHDGSRCYGAVVRHLVTGELIAYVAKATAIAAGGAGRSTA